MRIPPYSIKVAGYLSVLLPFGAAAALIENPLGRGATFSNLVTRIADFALLILGPLAAIMVLIAGAMYMTSGGSPERIKRAHRTLLWAVIGIAVVLLAKSAELIIQNLLGA